MRQQQLLLLLVGVGPFIGHVEGVLGQVAVAALQSFLEPIVDLGQDLDPLLALLQEPLLDPLQLCFPHGLLCSCVTPATGPSRHRGNLRSSNARGPGQRSGPSPAGSGTPATGSRNSGVGRRASRVVSNDPSASASQLSRSTMPSPSRS